MGSRVSGFRMVVGVSVFGFWVVVWGFGFRVSGFELCVWDWGVLLFRAWGFGPRSLILGI